jgi:ribosomal protein S18 acetylase RimI-like enzyme
MDIHSRQAHRSDTEFARTVHHLAYRDVVVRQFGVWEEKAQDEFFKDDWDPSAFEIIICDGVPCGYMCIEDRDNDIQVRELVISPQFQGKGAGTQILRGVIERAKARQVPVRLGTQHANRAVELYRRLGFCELERTGTHILMEWIDRGGLRAAERLIPSES